jgi:hypothetical protein
VVVYPNVERVQLISSGGVRQQLWQRAPSQLRHGHARRVDYSDRSRTRVDKDGNCIPRVLSFLGVHRSLHAVQAANCQSAERPAVSIREGPGTARVTHRGKWLIVRSHCEIRLQTCWG